MALLKMLYHLGGWVAGLISLTGLAMVVGGVVLVALDCGEMEKPWVLLVWGLLTAVTYGLVMWASFGNDWYTGDDEEDGMAMALVCCVGCCTFILVLVDAACAWWFAWEIITAWSHSKDLEDSCRTSPDHFAFVIMNVRFGFLALYYWIGGIILFYCCIHKDQHLM